MNFTGYFLCMVLLLGSFALARDRNNEKLGPLHHLIKRQAGSQGAASNNNGNQQQHGQGSSTTYRRHTSSSSRQFVSPDGQPYYEYRPPVSSSRGSSAATRVSVRGQGTGRQPIYTGRVRPSQTYDYPFGRERTAYYYETTQAPANQPSAEYDSRRTQSGQNQWRHETSYQTSSRQGAGSVDGGSSGQLSTNQQSQMEQARRWAIEEARRRQEEQRRRHEERRALYYAQLQASQQRSQSRLNDDTAQNPLLTTTVLPDLQTTQNTQTGSQQTYDQPRRQSQGQSGSTQQRVATNNQGGHSSGSSSYNPGSYTSSGQRTVYRTATGQQENRGYVPSNQQPGYRTSSTQWRQYTSYQRPGYTTYQTGTNQQGGYIPNNQQSVYRAATTNQRGVYNPNRYQTRYRPATSQSTSYTPNRQQVYRTQYQEIIPNQRAGGGSQVYTQGSRQSNPRRVLTSQQGTYPGFRTSYETQGQGQRYPYPSGSSSGGSGFSYGTYPSSSDCPETGIDLRIDGMDCRQAIEQLGTYLCYAHEYTSRQCCEVCRPRKQPSRIGCEFGDHAQLCSSITAADCYDLRNRQSCCETCERLVRRDAPAGCEYGDMTARCESVRQNRGLCYIPDNQRLCCETCSQIRDTTNPECPWGDYNPSLCQLFDENTSQVRINCYSQQRRRICCQACERLRDWIPDDLPSDCQYGDRPVIFNTAQFGRLNCSTVLTHFSVDECTNNPAVSVNCCHTCHRYIHGRG